MIWPCCVLFLSFAWVDAEPGHILAQVDGELITAAEVAREVGRALAKREVSGEERAALTKEVLALIVDRRLVLRYLERTKQAASDQDVDFAFAQFVKQLGRQEKTLAAYLEREQMTEPDVRRQFAWQLGWKRYLDRQLTDENLQKYFEKNRRDFDGTQLRIAHILWKTAADQPAAIEATKGAALKVREQIVSGKLSFEAAAKQYSQAPTAAEGGDLGWIRRHEPLPEAVSAAAFGLEKNGLSEPVVSPFGVHLIRLLDIQPGQIGWQERRDELEAAVSRYLFTYLAARERKSARVTFPAANQPD